jgi:hypothetical protein
VTDENQEKVLVESAEADAPMVFFWPQFRPKSFLNPCSTAKTPR